MEFRREYRLYAYEVHYVVYRASGSVFCPATSTPRPIASVLEEATSVSVAGQPSDMPFSAHKLLKAEICSARADLSGDPRGFVFNRGGE